MVIHFFLFSYNNAVLGMVKNKKIVYSSLKNWNKKFILSDLIDSSYKQCRPGQGN
jgi:hypothetical protein